MDPLGSPSSVPWPIDPRKQAASFFVDPCCDLVGLDVPTEEVANMVMDAGNKQAELKIVSIVGMPGSGKTTLANAVYRRLITEQSCFKCRAFVYVGLHLDLRKTLMDMLSDLLGNRHQVYQSHRQDQGYSRQGKVRIMVPYSFLKLGNSIVPTSE